MPEAGDRILTDDGMAVVIDSNVLMNQVKARTVIDEKTSDTPEKLSTDIFTYKKGDIRKIMSKKKKNSNKPEIEIPVDVSPDELLNILKE
jgi:hypothetical protein